jgi:ATP-dependent Clp protease, protease subunit
MNFSKDFNKYTKEKKVNNYKKIYSRMSMGFTGENFLNIDVFDKLLEERIIILSGEIDTYQCEFIKANLLYLESINNEDIKIYINSPGGSVYDGLGLLDIIDYIKPDVSTINTGLAASMAAVILASGAKGKRKSMKRSRIMIHQPMSYGEYYSQASDIEIDAKEINFIKKELYNILSEKTGQSYSKIESDADRDYWLGSLEAKKYGIIDDVLIKR